MSPPAFSLRPTCTVLSFAGLIPLTPLQGGSCEGPAGTGKTETVRELGKVTATLTVVSNCSEELDMTSILKILVGVASCGAWGCFDEFNRLGRGVLSVIAKYIHNIQIELAANSTKVRLAGDNPQSFVAAER